MYVIFKSENKLYHMVYIQKYPEFFFWCFDVHRMFEKACICVTNKTKMAMTGVSRLEAQRRHISVQMSKAKSCMQP